MDRAENALITRYHDAIDFTEMVSTIRALFAVSDFNGLGLVLKPGEHHD